MLLYPHAMSFCHAMSGQRYDPNTGARLDLVVQYPQQQEYALYKMPDPPRLHVEIEQKHLDTVRVHALEVAEYISHLHKQNAALTTQVQALQYAVQQAAGRLNGLLPPDLQLTANRA